MFDLIFAIVMILAALASLMAFGFELMGWSVAFAIVFTLHCLYRIFKGHWFEG